MTLFFFFNDTATTEIYTLSLHDALPISARRRARARQGDRRAARRSGAARPHGTGRARAGRAGVRAPAEGREDGDRKSTRLNSSHLVISYAVFCLKKKKTNRVTSYSS